MVWVLMVKAVFMLYFDVYCVRVQKFMHYFTKCLEHATKGKN